MPPLPPAASTFRPSSLPSWIAEVLLSSSSPDCGSMVIGVQAERVGAVALAHLVGRHHVVQRLAHLPVLTTDGRAVPRETTVRALHDLLGWHVEAARVGVGVGLDVALVEQPPERLHRADLAQVEQHLLPHPRVQQVQHRVLDAADVQVDAAGVAGPGRVGTHPVLLDLGIDEPLVVLRVQVAQVVPARARPLRHRVGLAPVLPGFVTVDAHPVVGAGQRRLGLGVGVLGIERLGRVVGDLRQLDGQLVLRHGHGTVGVPDDRERLAPVPLPGEQPVAQLVLHHGLARALRDQPVDDRPLRVGDAQPVQADAVVGGVDRDPSPVNASPSQASPGSTVRTIGSPNTVAKSQSRWSCAGTAMIAPVP